MKQYGKRRQENRIMTNRDAVMSVFGFLITYMLAGATQRSDSDTYDATSPPITVPPHWMSMWPFDPKATGLPVTHRDTDAYIMWAGSPYAHVHIMGRP